MKLTKITDTLWLDISTVIGIDTVAEPYHVVIYTTTRQHHVPIGHLDRVLQVLGATEPTSDTFTAHGLTWRKHRLGDGIPDEVRNSQKDVLLLHSDDNKTSCRVSLGWDTEGWQKAIGWNYADTP